MNVPAAYLGVIFIWSTTPLGIQWRVQGPDFAFAVAARMAIGLAVCAGLMVATRTRLPGSAAAWRLFAISGASLHIPLAGWAGIALIGAGLTLYEWQALRHLRRRAIS